MADQAEPTMTSSQIFPLRGKGSSMAKSSDDKYFIIGTREGNLYKLDLDVGIVASINPSNKSFWSMALDNKGSFYAASATGVIHNYKVDDFSEIRTLDGHTDEVNCIAISETGEGLFSCSDDKTVRQWSIGADADTIVPKTLYEHPGLVYAVDVQGGMVASGCSEKMLIVYSLQDLKVVTIKSDATDRIWCVKFAPDRKILAAGDQSSLILLYETENWVKVHVLQGHSERVRCLDFNDRYLVSGSLDANVRLWDSKNWNCVGVLKGHTDWVKSVAFSSDGAKVYSTGDDSTLAVWNIEKVTNPEKEKKGVCFFYQYRYQLIGIAVLGVALALGFKPLKKRLSS